MKESYKDVDDFIKEVMPIEYRKIIHSETQPLKRGSDSVAYKFEEKLEKLLTETEESNTDSEGQ